MGAMARSRDRKRGSMDETARLEVDGKGFDLPIVTGSEGERALDIANLRAETGLITLDPAYKNTGSCQSAITFIDGERGILRYRGYPIEELAESTTCLEVAYLLINGELPQRKPLEEWNRSIRYHTMLHENLKRLFGAFPKDAHPMAVSAAIVAETAIRCPTSATAPNARSQTHTHEHQ